MRQSAAICAAVRPIIVSARRSTKPPTGWRREHAAISFETKACSADEATVPSRYSHRCRPCCCYRLIVSNPASAQSAKEGAQANPFQAYVEITPENRIVIHSAQFEMGQGSYFGIASLVMEELDGAWAQVDVIGAAGNPGLCGNLAGGGRMQGTGGSTSMVSSWERCRGAARIEQFDDRNMVGFDFGGTIGEQAGAQFVGDQDHGKASLSEQVELAQNRSSWFRLASSKRPKSSVFVLRARAHRRVHQKVKPVAGCDPPSRSPLRRARQGRPGGHRERASARLPASARSAA
ncbi:hypothetical protein MPL3365_290053 [Mesorhizobium plurifarium]|uniref:Aldehyde oxidase/xanthine dehydrogenase second molybdopterin binding domain-containing protein n=1 Tax=Mesorhizobium plurifarium TaxID=69974 RepID=A0A090GDC8_MESPL|nr:hypothetical protein MPL3365_290053 [Mesorhizobium plurifarium]